jgi:hypothetical protein
MAGGGQTDGYCGLFRHNFFSNLDHSFVVVAAQVAVVNGDYWPPK